MSERDLYVYSFSVVFFHEMCLLVKILEKRIEKDIRFDEKWEVCTFSVFARLFGNRTNLQKAIFFLSKCVLVHSICLFWFRIEAIEDMRSGESCLKTFCGRSLTDVCDMMGHNSWENWMAMVPRMVLHLTVFPLIVKVGSLFLSPKDKYSIQHCRLNVGSYIGWINKYWLSIQPT